MRFSNITCLAIVTLTASLCALGYRLSPPLTVGLLTNQGVVIPTGEVLQPAGRSILIGRRPVAMALGGSGTVYVRDNEGISTIQAGSQKVTSTLRLSGSGLSGIVVSDDETRLYTSNSTNSVLVVDISSVQPVLLRSFTIPPGDKGTPYPAGLALHNGTLYVAVNRSNAVVALDIETGQVTSTFSTAPAPVMVCVVGDRLWVSSWGRIPGDNDASAPSSQTLVAVDKRGISLGGSVECFSIKTEKRIATWPVASQPGELLEDKDAMLVASADGDCITRLSLKVQPEVVWRSGLHASPTSMVALPAMQIGVSCGGSNELVVVNRETWRTKAKYKTGWYPIAVKSTGSAVIVACSKGFGSRSDDLRTGTYNALAVAENTVSDSPESTRSQRNVYQFTGLISTIDLQSDKATEAPFPRLNPTTSLKSTGLPTFRHVIYVIKENRTYDQVFGDVVGANGDPRLAIYGANVTPNHHKLAREFVLLDNYYCNGVLSADGHSWSTEGNATSFLERSFGGWTRSYPYGDEPLAISQTGHIWDHVLAKNLTFRNYGEYDVAGTPKGETYASLLKRALTSRPLPASTQLIGLSSLRHLSCRSYPGWNMNIPDVFRMRIFLQEFATFSKNGSLPSFMTVYLPQDHTSGTSAGSPTPAAHVADNDYAVGQLVDAVSRSPFWKDTAIFVVEDDPQAGFDHVDGHRSVCLVISPYSRNRGVKSTFYNQSSVLRTIKSVFGITQLTRSESLTSIMSDCFSGGVNLTPYRVVKPITDLYATNARTARAPTYDLRSPDRIPEGIFNRDQWHTARGNQPYPKGLSGAHGTGLGRLGLRLSPYPQPAEAGD